MTVMNLGYYRHYGDTEEHAQSSNMMRDIILGMSDGLTVPFAIAAGLAAGAASQRLIIAGGLAEIVAGSISMGLGGYLAAKNYFDYYHVEHEREVEETRSKHDTEVKEVEKILEAYGVPKPESEKTAVAISQDRMKWVNFMMRFELGLERPEKKQAVRSAATLAFAYVVGGLIPLSPYMLFPETDQAFLYSILFTFVALVLFGLGRGYFTAGRPVKSALETVVVGGVAASAAFFLAKII